MSKQDIIDIIDETIQKNYRKSQKKSVRQRYKGMDEGMRKLIQFVEESYKKEAIDYDKKKQKVNSKLEKIQEKAMDEIGKCLNAAKIDHKIIPASSFSAGTNLIEESDIDFAVLIKNINADKTIGAANVLGLCGYVQTDIRNTNDEKLKHWVFQKFHDKVEIEAKVRDEDGFAFLGKIHNYLDHKMSKQDKIYVTYLKYLLKDDKKAYAKFKMIYYSMAGYRSGAPKLLYPLI